MLGTSEIDGGIGDTWIDNHFQEHPCSFKAGEEVLCSVISLSHIS
jgi:hypothetical protein